MTNGGRFPGLARSAGWPGRLAAFLEARRESPFVWGGNDCASFGIRAVQHMTACTIWPVVWTNQREALATIAGAGGLEKAIASALGPPSSNWRLLRRGDVALVSMNGRQSVVVCSGQTVCGPGLRGVEHLPLTEAQLCWRVG